MDKIMFSKKKDLVSDFKKHKPKKNGKRMRGNSCRIVF